MLLTGTARLTSCGVSVYLLSPLKGMIVIPADLRSQYREVEVAWEEGVNQHSSELPYSAFLSISDFNRFKCKRCV